LTPAVARPLFSWPADRPSRRSRRPVCRRSSREFLVNDGFKDQQAHTPAHPMAITPLQKCPQSVARHPAAKAVSSGAPDFALGLITRRRPPILLRVIKERTDADAVAFERAPRFLLVLGVKLLGMARPRIPDGATAAA